MENIIIDEPHEKLVVKPGDNDTVVLILKRLSDYSKEWNTKVIILNRREALLINQAISQILLETVPTYEGIKNNILFMGGNRV